MLAKLLQLAVSLLIPGLLTSAEADVSTAFRLLRIKYSTETTIYLVTGNLTYASTQTGDKWSGTGTYVAMTNDFQIRAVGSYCDGIKTGIFLLGGTDASPSIEALEYDGNGKSLRDSRFTIDSRGGILLFDKPVELLDVNP